MFRFVGIDVSSGSRAILVVHTTIPISPNALKLDPLQCNLLDQRLALLPGVDEFSAKGIIKYIGKD